MAVSAATMTCTPAMDAENRCGMTGSYSTEPSIRVAHEPPTARACTSVDGDPMIVAEIIEALPTLMKDRRELLGLPMMAVSQATDVPMMTYRRFERGERDRLRLSHISSMLRWLDGTTP